MENFLPSLKNCFLFEGINEVEIVGLVSVLGGVRKHYKKEQAIFRAEEAINDIGIVLSGSVRIMEEDYWGNRIIIARMEQGDSFGEAFACIGGENPSVTVIAAEESEVLMIDYRRMMRADQSIAPFHAILAGNMIRALAQRTIMLRQKIGHLSKRTTREKILSYLSAQAQRTGEGAFEIPFNRQELADYLAVDRCAMTRELSRMMKEGILNFDRNEFKLIG